MREQSRGENEGKRIEESKGDEIMYTNLYFNSNVTTNTCHSQYLISVIH